MYVPGHDTINDFFLKVPAKMFEKPLEGVP